MKITETPRDGWQGIEKYIPVDKKVNYINTLLKVGFDIIELGSFVSPRAVPQLADTNELIQRIDVTGTTTKTMVLVASRKGGERVAKCDKIHYMSYPYSISETFLRKNLNADVNAANATLSELNHICLGSNKELLVYITMGFGNPYGDPWSLELLIKAVEMLDKMGIHKVLLTDIVGLSTPLIIAEVYDKLTDLFKHIEFGLHLHTTRDTFYDKVKAAYNSGCKRFDTVLTGLGGCPFTGKELLGNLDTFNLIEFMSKENIKHKLELEKLKLSSEVLLNIFKD